MKFSKSYFLILLLIILCFTSSGCSLLRLPFELAQAPFTLLSELVKFASKLPKPPPWVFF